MKPKATKAPPAATVSPVDDFRREAAALDAAVCTLFEGDYHYGVGALTNSLYQNGFRGVLWAGYRGALPPWATPIRKRGEVEEFDVAEGCQIRFIALDTPVFFSNYKPDFMLDLWEHFSPEADQMFYFDPDIVIKCRWSFFQEWAACGIALCLDGAYAHMPSSHPFRSTWRALARDIGYERISALEQYYNGGFLGVGREHRSVLSIWKEAMTAIKASGININSFKNYVGYNDIDRSHPFFVADQDALNVAAMATDHPLSVIGTEGMDFTGAGFTMSHAVDAPKPWQKHMSWMALKGIPPGTSDKHYLHYMKHPISLYSPATARLKWADYYFGRLLGRLVGQ